MNYLPAADFPHSALRENAEQRITATGSDERPVLQNRESRRPHDIFNFSLYPLLNVCVALHSGNCRLYPLCLAAPMDRREKQPSWSQDPLEGAKSLVYIAGTNVKQAEGSPESVETHRWKIKKPHVHFSNGRARHTSFGESNEALGEINGRNLIA